MIEYTQFVTEAPRQARCNPIRWLLIETLPCSFRRTQGIRHDKKPSPFDLPFSHSDPVCRIPRRRLRQKAGGDFRTPTGACHRRYRGHSGCSRLSRRYRQVCRSRSGFYPAAGFRTYRPDSFHGRRRPESRPGALYHRPAAFSGSANVAEANLAQSKAALDLAKINFDRVASVTDQRAVSRQDYDAKKNAVDVAEAQVKQNQAAVENARLNLDYCTIRSPINGRAGQRLVDLGNVVTANSGSLLVIQRLDPIYADFTITEKDLTAVQRNMASGTLKVEARMPDGPDQPRDGKLTFLDNSVQDGTGTIKLRATISNNDRGFWPGRFANIRLILGTKQNAVLIPAEAPQMSAKGQFVYVIKQDSTADQRPVTVGQRQGDLVVVDKGVQSGDRVVITGQLGVTPGGKVNITQPSTADNEPTPAKPGDKS